MGKLMGVTLFLACASVFAADRPADSKSAPAVQGQTTPNADNSKMNTRDKSGATQTPQDQAQGTEADRKLLAAIRRAVVADKSLSTSAHNVKIVTNGGVVTLRGPVNSEDEKGKVGQLAQQVAGVSRVENQLDVKTR
jgi:osmotically-inducible protein OsmY